MTTPTHVYRNFHLFQPLHDSVGRQSLSQQEDFSYTKTDTTLSDVVHEL